MKNFTPKLLEDTVVILRESIGQRFNKCCKFSSHRKVNAVNSLSYELVGAKGLVLYRSLENTGVLKQV